MNKCKVCGKKTKNKTYCSMKCRDINRKNKTVENRKCKICNNIFNVYKKSKKIYCSMECVGKDKELNKIKINKMKKTKLKKYGDENYVNFEKMKQTNLKKYGVEYTFQDNNIKEKIRQTNLEKYGVEYPQQNKNIKEKTRKSVIEKYGGFTMESEDLRKKAENTMIKKYGVNNASKSKDIRNKTRQTNLKKYNVEYGLSSNEIINKRKETLIKKYGVENVSQIKKISEKRSKKLIKKFYCSLFETDRLGGKVKPLFSIDEYTSFKKKYKFKCLKCKNEFEDNLMYGKVPRCLTCFPTNQPISFMEKEVVEYIKSVYKGKIIENDRELLDGKELDIYIPDKKIGIEFNGLYWHSEVSGKKNKNYHLNKTIIAESKGIHLIQIFEDEWIHKNDVVKSKLKNLLGLSQKKIYARNCFIKEINTKEKNKFLNKYHIQGEDKSNIKIGAFYNNKLVSVMTFGKKRIALGSRSKKNEYELIRFTTSQRIVGIASKLLKYFIKKHNPKKIISYADRRWSFFENNLYEKIGFNKVSEGTPNYWYISDDYTTRTHRFNFRKSVLKETFENFDSSLTEWQNMQLNGYDRIWDCGSLKYELTI